MDLMWIIYLATLPKASSNLLENLLWVSEGSAHCRILESALPQDLPAVILTSLPVSDVKRQPHNMILPLPCCLVLNKQSLELQREDIFPNAP